MGERRAPVSTLRRGMIGKEESKEGMFSPRKALRYEREGGQRGRQKGREKEGEAGTVGKKPVVSTLR